MGSGGRVRFSQSGCMAGRSSSRERTCPASDTGQGSSGRGCAGTPIAARAASRVLGVRVLVVGSGGREHALAWKLAQSPAVEELHAAPGNPGIAKLGACHPIRAEDGESLLALARTLGADLVVIGPEAPLVAGVADELRRGGVAGLRAERGGGADRGLERLCEGGHARGGRPDRGDDVRRPRPLRRQGRRARRRQGRLHVPDAGRAGRGSRSPSRLSAISG